MSIQTLRSAMVILLVLIASSCGNVKKEFADDLSATILESDDPETIKKGVPAYLILISSMIKGDPENTELLESGARLYGAYASGFADSEHSKKALAQRGFDYASRAICLRDEAFCGVREISYQDFQQRLKQVDKDQAAYLLVFISSWAGLIEANSDDWNAVAELPRVKAGIQRVIDMDETVSDGDAHLYMAVMESLLPPSLGGKPELARHHFDRAIEISGGQNLMAKVLYAEKYARMLFDRELHDRLLQQVIDTESSSKDRVLINTLAKQRAAELLIDGDEYF